MYLTTPLIDPAAWRRADFPNESKWTVTLTDTHIGELESAATELAAQKDDLANITKASFPLPTLASTLVELLDDLEGGRGFVRLSGMPTERWGKDISRLALYGMSLHLGWPEGQDKAGSLIHDVKDTGVQFGTTANVRYFETNSSIDFHNDGADVFALFCLAKGQEGGRSLLISGVEVFNEIVRRRPDLAQVLQEDFHFDLRGQRPDGSRCQVVPIYSYYQGGMSIILKTAYIHSAQRFDDVPRLSDKQNESLALLHEVLEDRELILEFDLEPGDCLIASNHTILHGRTGFVDGGDSDQVRHMLRLWLTIPNGRALPPHYVDTREFGATYARRM